MKVMVALDGSDDSLAALEYVACLALGPDDDVILVSVAETEPTSARAFRRQHGRHLALLLEASWAAKRAAAQRTLEDGQNRLGAWQAPVTQVIRNGHPVKVVAGLVDEMGVDLLILGPRGVGGWAAFLLGSVTLSLLGRARCPVLVARRPVDPPERIILAVDGSRGADAATRALATLPLAAGAIVDVVSVVTPWTIPAHDLPAEFLALGSIQEQVAGEIAQRAARTLTAAGIAAEPTVRTGDPARVIVDEARATDANLVVVGARGRNGLRGAFAGSVSRRVAAAAPCSVLVAPAPRPAAIPSEARLSDE